MSEILSFFTIKNLNGHFDYVLALIVVSSVLWYIWLYTKSKRIFPLLPPGPRGLPVVGNLPFLNPELHTYFHKLAQEHGHVFKLWLGSKLTIVISSSEATREILRTNDVIFANHDVPAVGPFIMYGCIDIVWSPYGPNWRMLRKICVNKLLSNATLDSNSFNSLRGRETRRTVRYLADRARTGSPVNVGEQIFVTMLNVVTQMLWGATVADGEERDSVGAEFWEVITEIVDTAGIPNVSDFFPVLSRFDVQGLVKRTRRAVQRIDQVFDRVIDQRMRMDKESKGNGEDFLQVLLNVKDEDERMSIDHVKALLMDMVLGGTDTTLNTIVFAMAEVINKPEIMKRAQQELDKVVGKSNIVEETHITKLPYILSIMKETLRLHPTLPLLLPRCPSEATVVGGYTIPKDSKVFINAWAIHRNPDVWENPLEFNPDRFLDKSYDFSGSGNNYSYFPFGSGRRMCAGMAMAERVVLYNLATFLHSFDWSMGEGEKVDLKEKFGVVLKLKNPLIATPVLRLSDPNLYL